MSADLADYAAAVESNGAARPGLSLEDGKALCFFLSKGAVGQERDWQRWHERVNPLLYRYAAARLADADCRDPHTANDVVQQAWLAFCQRKSDRLLQTVQQWGSVLAFLYQLIRDKV